jgi:transmembrane protein
MHHVPGLIASALDNRVTVLFARTCLTLPFWVAGFTKVVDWQGGMEEMSETGLRPAWLLNLLVLITELCGSTLVVLNHAAWLGAGMLAAFTVLSTFLAHRFWELAGKARAIELNRFVEHVAIAAAFILVVVVGLRDR